MKVFWSIPAKIQLVGIFEYLEERNSAAAHRMLERIQEREQHLEEYPRAGRPGKIHGTRELVISGTPYVVAYRVHEMMGEVEIAAVRHGARRWPERLN